MGALIEELGTHTGGFFLYCKWLINARASILCNKYPFNAVLSNTSSEVEDDKKQQHWGVNLSCDEEEEDLKLTAKKKVVYILRARRRQQWELSMKSHSHMSAIFSVICRQWGKKE
jgi:hypothetical protein